MSRDDAEAQARADYARRSDAELEAGRLPLRAQERLAAMRADQAFTSDLSIAEHHVVRSVGFAPVGQVMGASVFQIGYTGGWDCGIANGYGYGPQIGIGGLGGTVLRRGGAVSYGGGLPGGMGGGFSGAGLGGGFNSGGFSGAGMGDGPGYRGTARGSDAGVLRSFEVTPWKRALREAQQRAVGRLQQEAAALGADGVVAVRFTEQQVTSGAVEFLVVGTAVRSTGPTHTPGRLFTCDLSGQDFAQLVLAGYLPTSLLFGVAVMTRHDDWTTRLNSQSWSNVELAGYTQLSLDARAEARLAFAREAAAGGAGFALMGEHRDHLSEHECAFVEGRHDHLLRTTYVGTGVVEVGRPSAADLPDALPILRLNTRRATVTETTR